MFLSFGQDTLTCVLSAFVRHSPGKDQAAVYKSAAHRAVSAEARPGVLSPLSVEKKMIESEGIKKKRSFAFSLMWRQRRGAAGVRCPSSLFFFFYFFSL